MDYRLNFRLDKACASDVDSLCKTVCSREEGQVCVCMLLPYYLYYIIRKGRRVYLYCVLGKEGCLNAEKV